MQSRPLRCVIMRGGTSKAMFLRETDLPRDDEARDRVVLRLFGSPDRRQIDGLGGAEPLTSKLAIIGPASHPGSHCTFTFAQVDIEEPIVDFRSLCGNITSAVGHYAVYEGLVPLREPDTTVRIYNTNLQRELRVEVPVSAGRPEEEGDYAIAGVPGTGARILVDLAQTAGGTTGALLPTGSALDVLDVPGVGRVEASLVDIGNAHVFVRAADVGMHGAETPAEIDSAPGLRDRLEAIRGTAAHRLGMVTMPERSRTESPATPILAIVAPPASYVSHLGGDPVAADAIDILARVMYMQITHKTYAGTSTVCTGVAARIPGTTVAQALSAGARDRLEVRIGHPAGVIETESDVERTDKGYIVHRATFGRTARRLMEGYAFVPSALFDAVR